MAAKIHEEYSVDAADQRRDEVIRRMLTTPPQPKKPVKKVKIIPQTEVALTASGQGKPKPASGA